MKISVIHNLYKRNPYVNESVQYNLHALKEANVDYQYILFNDNGDKEIFDALNISERSPMAKQMIANLRQKSSDLNIA